MKFTRIRLAGPTYVNLPLVGATSDGPFVLKNAEGLGPPEIEVKKARTVLEGGVLQGRRAQDRQIVLRIGLQPDWDTGQTAEELRTILYGMLTPRYGHPIDVEIMQDTTLLCAARGYASKFEVAYFTDNPEVQITIDCNHPYLKAPETLYQLPERSIVNGRTSLLIDNIGTAPVGFWMSIRFTDEQNQELEISDDSSSGETMVFRGAWEAGDVLTLDTRARSRGAWKRASGTVYTRSVLGSLRGFSPWLQLHGGDNVLRINNLEFDWYGQGFGHRPSYWGV